MIDNTLYWIIDKERVREAFKDFVHALVWESKDIEEGASEEEIDGHIDLYVKTKGDGKINDFRNEYMSFLLDVYKKFKIEVYTGYYECTKCHHKFIPSYFIAMLMPHIGTTRIMKCPECGKIVWAKKTMTK